MNSIFVFSESDAEEMLNLGFSILEKKTDINGKEIWCFLQPNNLTFSEKQLPTTAVVKNSVCKSF